MVEAFEDLGWPNRARVGWQGERLFVLSLLVTAIVFDAGEGFSAHTTCYSLSVLAVLFSLMASQRVRPTKGLLTQLTSRHARDQ